MHELSIAEAIVRIADTHAAGRRVMCVEVEIGHLRQVVPSALSSRSSSWRSAPRWRGRSWTS